MATSEIDSPTSGILTAMDKFTLPQPLERLLLIRAAITKRRRRYQKLG